MDYTGQDVVLQKDNDNVAIIMAKDNEKTTLTLSPQEAAQLMSFLLSCFGMTLEDVGGVEDDDELKVLN